MNNALGINPNKNEHSIQESTELEVEARAETTLIHNIIKTLSNLDQINIYSFLIYLLVLLSLLYLLKHYSYIPWHIIAASFGILIGYSKRVRVETLQSKFGSFSMKFFNLTYLKNPSLTFFVNPELWTDALPIAFISILETLLSAKVGDARTGTLSDKNQEIFALGISNICSGVLGGIPMTAALSRSTLNIKSGQKVLILGKTGSGKSSIAQVLNRMYHVNTGEVSVDGQTGRELEAVSLQSDVSITVQFESDPALPCPTFATGFALPDGQIFTSAYTLFDGIAIERDAQGRGQATVVFEKLPLMKGRFSIGAYLFDERALHV
jgi:ABC-type multidrug transport system fused ATPase/permease subunit